MDAAIPRTLAKPFVVFALPRSRTTWLSRFLSYGEYRCGHEELRHCRSLDDISTWFTQPYIGTAETAAAPFWRLLSRVAPDVNVLVVRRPVPEVVDSLMNIPGVAFDRQVLVATMSALDRKLDQIEGRLANVLSVDFAGLEREDVCAAAFEHCLPYSHDSAHWQQLALVNVQCDMVAIMRHFAACRPALDKLASIAKHRTLTNFAKHEPIAPDGITLQTEAFDSWERDGEALFREHCVIVGETPDNWRQKNLPLMRKLYELGAMQIMTARCNGRMFGYLMTIIAPSLERENLITSQNTTFYASPEFPGMGLKLQRAAIKALAERGVGEVKLQAGVRGSGERVEALFRRMGAEYGGKVYRLDLKEAA